MELVQTDILARYQRLRGNSVFFTTGTDENALKNLLSAREQNKPVREFVASNANEFLVLARSLDISFDEFIRTSVDPRHLNGALKLWNALRPEDVTTRSYQGQYCVGCEEFKTSKELTNGECAEHPGRALEFISEVNYFFELQNYQSQLEALLASGALRIHPPSRANEMLAFIRSGLTSISISRSSKRAGEWGIKVPKDPSQVMYVWIDALSNYVNALGYDTDSPKFHTYWNSNNAKFHVIGKGISRFHAVYWPALLLSAGLPLPTDIFVHGYLTSEGRKISKSSGNVINPQEYITQFGADAFRYFIAREVSVFEDSDFTYERFAAAYQGALVGGLGNLVARITKLGETHLSQPVKAPPEIALPAAYCTYLDAGEITKASDFIWEKIQSLDRYISHEKPYSVIKSDPEGGRVMIEKSLLELYEIAYLLQPLLPGTSSLIFEAIQLNRKPESLFPRH